MLLVGLSSAGLDRQPRRRPRGRLRLPLGPRPRRRARLDGGRGRAGDARRGAAAPGRRGDAACRSPTGRALPALEFLEAATLGLGAVIGGMVTVPALGFMVAAAFLNQGPKDRRPRPDRATTPRASTSIATFMRRCRAGRGVAPHRLRPQQRRRGRASRASRSSRTAVRTSAARCSQTGRSSTRRRRVRARHADPDDSGRLRLPVPRRPVRQRGEPHRRAARALARPLRVFDPERQPLPRQAVLGRPRRGRRRERRRSRSTRSPSRASTSTGSSRGCTRSSLPTDGDEAHDEASRPSRRSSTRSSGSRSAPG